MKHEKVSIRVQDVEFQIEVDKFLAVLYSESPKFVKSVLSYSKGATRKAVLYTPLLSGRKNKWMARLCLVYSRWWKEFGLFKIYQRKINE